MANEKNVHIGNSGEYFVAAELERRGMVVAVPMSNVQKVDLLVMNPSTLEQFAIQVKTTEKSKKDWTLGKKNEDIYSGNFFYVFVTLNKLDTPEFHIVPSEIVAKTIKKDFKRWLETPGKRGQKHNGTDKTPRHFYDKENKYLSRWDYIVKA